VQHAAGLVVGLARAARADWEDRPLPVPASVVLAGDEHYVSNAVALRFMARQQELGAAIELTTLPAVPNEMLTPFENIGREMGWLECLARRRSPSRSQVPGNPNPGTPGWPNSRRSLD
jgi:hypothetical protein